MCIWTGVLDHNEQINQQLETNDLGETEERF